jgi:hypothetical protein
MAPYIIDTLNNVITVWKSLKEIFFDLPEN